MARERRRDDGRDGGGPVYAQACTMPVGSMTCGADREIVMARRNALYAQSGGVTAVINASACGMLQAARQHSGEIGQVYAGRNGILGVLTEDLIDTSIETEAAIAALKYTPGAAFGSCRYKLASIQEHHAQYERLIEVFQAHDIG